MMATEREIDRRIHTAVMGLPLTTALGPDHPWLVEGTLVKAPVPRYSSDIAAAWTIIGHFYQAGWGAGASMDGHTGCEAFVGQFVARADTAPLAICLAALQAVGVEITP